MQRPQVFSQSMMRLQKVKKKLFHESLLRISDSERENGGRRMEECREVEGEGKAN